MTDHLGNVPASSVQYFYFETVQGSGAGITISNFATSDIRIYRNGSTTERASTNGYALLDTDGIDIGGVTGLHGFSVDLSDNSDAGFYAAGNANIHRGVYELSERATVAYDGARARVARFIGASGRDAGE